jgi:hypothetical protein
MFVSKKYLSRRTVLRGMVLTLALPLLGAKDNWEIVQPTAE